MTTTLDDMPLDPDVQRLTEQVSQLAETNEFLQESLAELEMDDRGWVAYSAQVAHEFSGTGRQRIVEICRMMSISHPLLKRGLTIRAGYIWGQGVQVSARVGKDNSRLQDQVNQVIETFEKLNEQTFTGMGARDELERAQGTDGEVFLALFTSPLTGEVKVRTVPQLEIRRIITNPEDDAEPWFYLREYTVEGLPKADEPIENRPTRQERCIYPALGFNPRDAGLGFKPPKINGMPVMWDAPMKHVPVNRLDGWTRGIPDVYASVAWARLYRDFMIDWAGLTHSLSQIAFKATGESKSRASQAAASIRARANAQLEGTELPLPRGQTAGATVAQYGVDLQAVSKSGATIDAHSGKPLAGMIAAGLGLPVTMLLSDPGTTGARAVAQTLDLPTVLEMGMRRLLWQSAMNQIFLHAIAVAGMRPGSPLRGLTGDSEPTILFNWPPLGGVDEIQLVAAIVQADSTGKMPPPMTAKLLLQALGVENVDEVLKPYVDADGNWISPDPAANAGDAAVQKARRGQDPASGYQDPMQGVKQAQNPADGGPASGVAATPHSGNGPNR